MATSSFDHTQQWPVNVRGRSGYNLRLRTDAPLGQGGEGIVFRTENDQFAVKILATASAAAAGELPDRLDRLRWLPLEGIPICRPLEPLAPPHAGYVMELLEDMVALRTVCGDADEALAAWYARSGGLLRRLILLARCAEIFSTLHERGIVYGDVSPGNVLISARPDFDQVWLIDADNLQTESNTADRRLGTPLYTAPELLRGTSGNTAACDLYSFAVVAYETLTTNHPLLGDYVQDGPQEYEDAAQRGLLPWIDHSSDDRNRAGTGFKASAVTTAGLRDLFTRTFEVGLTDPRARPAAGEWTDALRTAAGRTVWCPACEQTYFVVSPTCPWCGGPRPQVMVVAVEERLPRLGEFPSLVLPREDRRLVLQAGRRLVVWARTTDLDPEDGDRPMLALEWDGDEGIRIRNLGPTVIRRVPPQGGNGMQFFPGASTTDNINAPWSLHFGAEQRPHRILRVNPILDGS